MWGYTGVGARHGRSLAPKKRLPHCQHVSLDHVLPDEESITPGGRVSSLEGLASKLQAEKEKVHAAGNGAGGDGAEGAGEDQGHADAVGDQDSRCRYSWSAWSWGLSCRSRARGSWGSSRKRLMMRLGLRSTLWPPPPCCRCPPHLTSCPLIILKLEQNQQEGPSAT
ncbi:uncharacterized protein FN964_010671 isoform 1-T1 [Alca torda]